MSDHSEEDKYHPKDALGNATNAVMLTGGAGLVVSGVQNALARQNYGLFGLFTRSGSTIAMFAAMGGAYSFIRDASANLRETEDVWNTTIGGFVAGSLIGIRYAKIPAVLGFGAGLASLLASFEVGGGTLRGFYDSPKVDEVARKDQIRTTRRRPVEETLAEIGEGRGIFGPGYAERRRLLLKEKYGIDVPAGPEKPYA
ncbi:hypothetical protein ABW19_dt0204220 [Dactylella cylindrospora]|nr:hypothetical protein ABW19_dt0204220 [Dactylella cylindrospora]